MAKLSFATVATVLAVTIAASPVALARGPGGVGGGHGFAAAGGPPVWQGSNPPGFSEGEKTGWRGGSVPPGWSKGHKRGWNSRTVPPGLYGR